MEKIVVMAHNIKEGGPLTILTTFKNYFNKKIIL